jgi:hypothetical protein
MGKTLDTITDQTRAWIERRELFFVGTAPLAGDGHVNVSPKGPIGTLRVLDERTVAYLDLVGSGAETVAHLRENGRICVMLCAFEGPPRILRLHGTGTVLFPEDAGFGDLLERCAFDEPAFPEQRRSIVRVDVGRIADSCGYGVPLMEFQGQRPNSRKWAEGRLRKDGPDALERYQAQKNAISLDGLPAVPLR